MTFLEEFGGITKECSHINTDNFSTVKVSSGGCGEQSQSGGQEEARKW